MTIVGKAVELAGIIPEINKLNMTIESSMVISNVKNLVQYIVFFSKWLLSLTQCKFFTTVRRQ